MSTAVAIGYDWLYHELSQDKHGGEWVVLDASPGSKIENQNKGVHILAFTAPPAAQLELKVRFARP